MTAEEALRAAQEALDAAQEAVSVAVRDRDAAIREARSEGMPAARIASVLGVERQVVYRILNRS